MTSKEKQAVAVVGLLLGLASLAKACERTPDERRGDQVRDDLRTWAQSIGPVADVRCPEQHDDVYDCTIIFAEGGSGSVHVHESDKHFVGNWAHAIMRVDDLVAMILRSSAGAGTIDCGRGIVEVGPAGVYCTITESTAARRVHITSNGTQLSWAPVIEANASEAR